MTVARRIVSDIERLELEAGDRLPPEHKMLENLEVGRGTLRESLRFLELHGVLSIKPGPGGGPVVERPDASNLARSLVLLLQFHNARFRAIVESRDILEPILARLAAEHITDAQLAELEETIGEMRNAIEERNRFLDQNQRFHAVIAWASGNPLFALIVNALLGIIDGTVVGMDYPIHRRTAILEAHVRIFDTMVARDPDGAEEAMRSHIGEYARYAEVKFPEVFEEPVTWDLLPNG